MAVDYSAGLKNTRMIAVRDAIDAGVGNATLEICSAGFVAVLGTLILDDPASSVAADVLTILGVPIAVIATGAGTAAVARVKDPSGAVVINNLTVGLVGTNIIITNPTVGVGDTLTMTAGTITHG